MVDVTDRAALADRRLRDQLARPRLTRELARLYSQNVRLRTGQGGLRSFNDAEVAQRLSDAVRLVEASFAARDRADSDWKISLRRAAELLEWLAHSETNPEGLPLSLLGAACYHLAGYPARAASLSQQGAGEQDAPLLRLLLASDYAALLALASQLATERIGNGTTASETSAEIHDAIVVEIAAALAVVVAEFRWGGGRRTTQALDKLRVAASIAMTIADPYEWLLLKLSAEAAQVMVASSLRIPIAALADGLDETGREVFERYVRLAYLNRQMMVWPSQARGLGRLADAGSFALCTPTGSGKTRVAEVALLEGLFRGSPQGLLLGPLCLYIVPTRSLAAEVEARFSRVLRRASGARAVTVTGLYGGTDWGPSDDWLSLNDPTVLICTQEKAEALVRFFGHLLLPRLRVVIVDEAHEVQYVGGADALERSESRALRLESLVSRLRVRAPHARFIAMSAVAQELERPLSRWISGDRESDPVTSDYRSTRQLVGRLLCRAGGTMRIEYDVLDGELLEVQGLGDDAAYVPEPFPSHPPAPSFVGPKKGMAPYALWSAMQLAHSDTAGAGQAVLISVVEGIANFTGWCVSLLENDWAEVRLPSFFADPLPGSDARRLFDLALTVTEDFFGSESRELRLLRRGIVVHHGRMPGRLPRILVELIDRRIVRVVIATSTLTQGVNLPFETILIPGLSRQSGRLTIQEFKNLIGRAGRPGVATEGQALVLLLANLPRWQRLRHISDYRGVLLDWTQDTRPSGVSRSPLAALITLILERFENRWPQRSPEEFESWLETTAVAEADVEDDPLLQSLDALDGILLASLAESDADFEESLHRVWAETFARYASAEEARLERAFLARGGAVSRRFADTDERRRVYQTSLPPRDAQNLYAAAPALIAHLQQGTGYSGWDVDQRFSYVERAVELVSTVRRFAIAPTVGQSTATWREVLRWWFDPSGAPRTPTVSQVGAWHDFISQWFAYRFSWGLTAMTLLTIPPDNELTPDLWLSASLPPAALWIKDLVLWGTLDPVAAFLLSRRLADARPDAEALARSYYDQLDSAQDLEPLDPATIRAWATSLQEPQQRTSSSRSRSEVSIELSQRITDPASFGRWRVLPLAQAEELEWIDVAGYVLATSRRPTDWSETEIDEVDFVLDAEARVVRSTPYL